MHIDYSKYPWKMQLLTHPYSWTESGHENINNFSSPVLLFHCIPDDRIPIKHSQDISKFLPANSEYFEFDYCDHSNAYEIEKKEFTQMLKTYFESSFN